MCQTPQPATADPPNLTQMQFDYAWKWFSYHAEQRTKMFNYMLLAIGIFATGVIGNFEKHPLISAILCFFAAGLAVLFSRLDYRNQELVWLGEDVLIYLEKEKLFGTDATIPDARGKLQTISFGLLYRQIQERDQPTKYPARSSEPFLRELNSIRRNWHSGKHRYLLRGISYLVAAAFGLAGVGLLIAYFFCAFPLHV